MTIMTQILEKQIKLEQKSTHAQTSSISFFTGICNNPLAFYVMVIWFYGAVKIILKHLLHII